VPRTSPEPLHLVVASRAVAPQHGFGGLERAVAHKLRHLARLGVRMTVFTQPPHPGAPPREDFAGLVAWREVPYWTAPVRPRRNSIPDRLLNYGAFVRALGLGIADLARRERVDAVHAQGLAGVGYARELLAAGRSIADAARGLSDTVPFTSPRAADDPLPPLVFNPQGLEEFGGRNRAKHLAYAPFRRGLRLSAAAAAVTISTDRALDPVVARHLHLPPGKIVTIPNGVDVAQLDALVRPALVRALRERERLDASPLTLASVARLERNKGLREALAALALLRDRLPPGWRWLIVGRGSEEGRLRALIGEYGFGRNVALLGARSDEEVQALLESVDLFLVPSLYEGSSLVALEAMAHRLPLVATRAGGLPDKALPGVNGFLAAPGSAASLRAALAAALDARAGWPAYGARSRAIVEREFDWPRLAERYLALYEALRARR
jgi:glycosyltransferase involved in cell wall biosynthesis